jgi:WD40 repeat protein
MHRPIQQHSIILSSILAIIFLLYPSPAAQTGESSLPFISGGLAWDPEGEIIAVGTSEGIWLHRADDLTTVEQLSTLPFITSLDWISPNRIIAGATSGIQILDPTTGQTIFDIPNQRERVIVTSVAWSPDSTMYAAVFSDSLIQIWDAQTGQLLQEIQLESGQGRYDLTWSPNSQMIATIVVDSEVEHISQITIWNAESGELSFSWISNQATGVISWNPQGATIATRGSDGFVRIWNADTGELLYTLEADLYYVVGFTWSPDGRRLASAGAQTPDTDNSTIRESTGRVRIWDGQTGHRMMELDGPILTGEVNSADALAWSPDGTRLASVSDDGRIFLWDMETYEQIAVYEGYRSILLSDQ